MEFDLYEFGDRFAEGQVALGFLGTDNKYYNIYGDTIDDDDDDPEIIKIHKVKDELNFFLIAYYHNNGCELNFARISYDGQLLIQFLKNHYSHIYC